MLWKNGRSRILTSEHFQDCNMFPVNNDNELQTTWFVRTQTSPTPPHHLVRWELHAWLKKGFLSFTSHCWCPLLSHYHFSQKHGDWHLATFTPEAFSVQLHRAWALRNNYSWYLKQANRKKTKTKKIHVFGFILPYENVPVDQKACVLNTLIYSIGNANIWWRWKS